MLTQRTATIALHNIVTYFPDSQAAIGAAGAIPALVRLLSSGSPGLRNVAAGALGTAARDPANLDAAVASGGISALLTLTQTSGDEEGQIGAAQALQLITLGSATGGSAKRAILDAGGAQTLLQALGSASDTVQLELLRVLVELSWSCPQGEQAIAAACGVSTMKRLLAQTSSANVKCEAAIVLHNVTFHTRKKHCVVCGTGATPGVKVKLCQACQSVGLIGSGAARASSVGAAAAGRSDADAGFTKRPVACLQSLSISCTGPPFNRWHTAGEFPLPLALDALAANSGWRQPEPGPQLLPRFLFSGGL